MPLMSKRVWLATLLATSAKVSTVDGPATSSVRARWEVAWVTGRVRVVANSLPPLWNQTWMVSVRPSALSDGPGSADGGGAGVSEGEAEGDPGAMPSGPGPSEPDLAGPHAAVARTTSISRRFMDTFLRIFPRHGFTAG